MEAVKGISNKPKEESLGFRLITDLCVEITCVRCVLLKNNMATVVFRFVDACHLLHY